MKCDYLIVGAGFSGCVMAERLATELDKKILIIEKRDHVCGNAFDYYDEHRILVHKYGPHIFHTNSKKVWDYLSHFTEWRPYEHKVLADVDGFKVPVPFNLNSLHKLFEPERARKLERLLVEKFGYGRKISILQMRKIGSGDLRELADFVYEKIFYGYTIKQWGLKPEELDASVTARVPVSIGRDDRYFQDVYQAIPRHGYTDMFKSILNNPNIEVWLGADYKKVLGDVSFDQMIYTGRVDEFFDYVHGELPYRSLRFEFRHHDEQLVQKVGTINYPNCNPFTRITEIKHISGQKCDGTVTITEYPEILSRGHNIPYYPVPTEENEGLYQKYRAEQVKLKDSVHFIGRLADYKYYNMDQAVARALMMFEEEICKSYA